MIRWAFNEKEQVLEAVFSGTVSHHDIIDCMDKINKNNDYPRVLNILIDARNAMFNFSPDEVKTVATANFRMAPSYRRIRNAIVIDDPRETAFTMLYQNASKSRNYEVKIFTLKENALDWLKS